jgi:hypothetical protein
MIDDALVDHCRYGVGMKTKKKKEKQKRARGEWRGNHPSILLL